IKVPNVPSTVDDYRRYVDELGIPRREPKANEVIDRKSLRPYVPLPMDAQYGQKNKQKYLGQGSVFGVLQTPPEASLGAYMGNEALQELKKIKTNTPFSLTLSIGPPHPPFIIPEKYASLFDPEKMSIPMSIGDDLLNAPYERSKKPYDSIFRNPENIQQMKALYYGMVVQVDNWVGKLLDELDRKGVTDNTLVVFTSDHGELLGDHGMSGKGKMYEGSTHIPLLMRLPNAIPAGTKINTPVSHHDIYSTILDYAGTDIPSNDGYSLRKLIENEPGTLDYTVSVWGDIEHGGPFMIRQGDWKLIVYLPVSQNSSNKTNALYNLKIDPLEMNNLIGSNPEKDKYAKKARELKKMLREWMKRTDTPYIKELEKISI
ncbi:MAG: sulfatase-like hydrolase/transferase, partial [Flavobacteriaceae bacterium]|nr:sulfatase-like hydrolase/transferase [Flavobacteriaceae bacterium]